MCVLLGLTLCPGTDMERLRRILHKERRLVAGLMSGTSLDGIDAALVYIQGSGTATRVEEVAFLTVPYESRLRKNILAACRRDTSDVEMICRLNFTLGKLFAAAVQAVCRKAGIVPAELDLIGSHGQTLWHCPGESTLQIGEAAVIAEDTGVPTIADFRVRDVAAGGQGAPLVPYTEYILFRDRHKCRLLQNIGGIANVTVLPADARPEMVTAFDTGPGNMMIDACVNMVTNGRKQFDENGDMAARGSVHCKMLAELLAHPYLAQLPPKTTGREVFGEEYTEKLVGKYRERGVQAEDLVATLTCFSAQSILDAYRRFIFPRYRCDEVIVCGGGSHNRTLLSMLRQGLPDMPVLTLETLGFSSDAKEAVAFAVLANEALCGRANNLPGVTGARAPVVMGKISL